MTEQDSATGVTHAAEFTNVADLISRHVVDRPGAIALIDARPSRRALTWTEFDAQVTAVAAGLAARGLVASHRVALLGPNSLEYVIAYFGALRAGFVVVPINPQSSADEVAKIVSDSGARVLLTAVPHELAEIESLPLTADGIASLAARSHSPVDSPQDREALAVLLYTAGTSGDPKVAMLSHRALLAHLHQICQLGVASSSDTALALLPLFHVFGLNAVLGSAVHAGATLVIMDGFTDDAFDVIREEGVTNLPVAPSAIYRMLHSEHLESAMGSVTKVFSGAAPLPPALGAEFERRTGLRVEQGYGLTEAAPGVTTTWGTEIHGPGHVGRALPGVEIRIGDGSDESEPAEIWIRGDNLFSGYWPDGHNGPDAEGWFATGDIGYLTEGDLHLVDRTRELIIVSGFNVYPAEIEEVVLEIDGVRSVAVIGQPHDRTGERVVAFVVADGLTAEQITAHCEVRLAKFKQLSEVHLVAELPRGATGKIKKGALRRMLNVPEV